jgi:hypothetical protein
VSFQKGKNKQKIAKMSERKLPKDITYDICIKREDIYYVIGKFCVRVYKGELMFIPKQKYVRKDKNKMGEEVEHFMWHASGQFHLKKKKGLYDVHQASNGATPLKETGFQPLINIYVKDINKLSPKNQLDRLDVVLNVGGFNENLCVEISLVSGKWLLEKRPEVGFGFIVTDPLLPGLIAKDRRFMGPHSDNADKIIQFSASKIEFLDKDPNIDINVMITTFANQNVSR